MACASMLVRSLKLFCFAILPLARASGSEPREVGSAAARIGATSSARSRLAHAPVMCAPWSVFLPGCGSSLHRSFASKEAMQEMVGEFICFVTSEANDLCKEDPQPGKKTLHGAHITGACANLDLAELVAPIRAAALPTSRGSLPDARAKGKIAKQNSFNDLTSLNTFTAVH